MAIHITHCYKSISEQFQIKNRKSEPPNSHIHIKNKPKCPTLLHSRMIGQAVGLFLPWQCTTVECLRHTITHHLLTVIKWESFHFCGMEEGNEASVVGIKQSELSAPSAILSHGFDLNTGPATSMQIETNEARYAQEGDETIREK